MAKCDLLLTFEGFEPGEVAEVLAQHVGKRRTIEEMTPRPEMRVLRVSGFVARGSAENVGRQVSQYVARHYRNILGRQFECEVDETSKKVVPVRYRRR